MRKISTITIVLVALFVLSQTAQAHWDWRNRIEHVAHDVAHVAEGAANQGAAAAEIANLSNQSDGDDEDATRAAMVGHFGENTAKYFLETPRSFDNLPQGGNEQTTIETLCNEGCNSITCAKEERFQETCKNICPPDSVTSCLAATPPPPNENGSHVGAPHHAHTSVEE